MSVDRSLCLNNIFCGNFNIISFNLIYFRIVMLRVSKLRAIPCPTRIIPQQVGLGEEGPTPQGVDFIKLLYSRNSVFQFVLS